MMKTIAFLIGLSVLASGLHVKLNHEAAFGTGTVALKSDAGTYLTRCTNCGSSGAYLDSAALSETSSSGAASQWTVETVGNRVAFKADTGKYLARCSNCWSGITGPDTTFVHITSLDGNPYALWTPEDLGNGKWAFKADTGKYLTRCGNCDQNNQLSKIGFVDGTSSGNAKAQWTVEFKAPPSGRVNIWSDLNTLISRCTNCALGGTAPDAPAIFETNTSNPKTIWTVEKVGNQIALKSDINKYLATCNNCWKNSLSRDSVLVFAVEPTSAQNALWTPEYLGNGKWALKAGTGKYLVRCSNCLSGAVAPNFAFASAATPNGNPLAQWTITKAP